MQVANFKDADAILKMLKVTNQTTKLLAYFSQFIKCVFVTFRNKHSTRFPNPNLPNPKILQTTFQNTASFVCKKICTSIQTLQQQDDCGNIVVRLYFHIHLLDLQVCSASRAMSELQDLSAGPAAGADSDAKCGAGHHDCFAVIMQSKKAPAGSTSLNVKLIAERLFCFCDNKSGGGPTSTSAEETSGHADWGNLHKQ